MTDEALSSAVHQEMSHWFGPKQTDDWKLLRVYRVPFAQPNQVAYLMLQHTLKCVMVALQDHELH